MIDAQHVGGDCVPTAADIVELLDVVADHSVDHALSDIDRVVARLREGATQAARARALLRSTPVSVLREALRLRAARDADAADEECQDDCTRPAAPSRVELVTEAARSGAAR